MKITVIGGNGFIGYHVVKAAVARDIKVQALSLRKQKGIPMPDDCTEFFGDIADMQESDIAVLLCVTGGAFIAADDLFRLPRVGLDQQLVALAL